MRTLTKLPSEDSLLYSPVALELQDEFTGGVPQGRVTLRLQEKVVRDGGSVVWRETGVLPLSSGGIYSYPGLGRTQDTSRGPKTCRIVINADYYRPHYHRHLDGLVFEAHPYNDQAPLLINKYAHEPNPDLDFKILWPNSSYPFPIYAAVVRGRVVKASPVDEPVVDAEVSVELSGGPLTDEHGDFALAIRLPPRDTRTTSSVTIGQDLIGVDRIRGLLNGKVEIEGTEFDVIGIESGDAQNPGMSLKLNPGADKVWDADTRVRVISFALTIKPKGIPNNVVPPVFQIPITQGFKTFQKFTINTP
ncbi:MAG TPA: hypothetical protein PLY87_23015 [Planctomycetaceae bacterium]|nr:hypothetical protein [Planctomycetaceae bacterium]